VRHLQCLHLPILSSLSVLSSRIPYPFWCPHSLMRRLSAPTHARARTQRPLAEALDSAAAVVGPQYHKIASSPATMQANKQRAPTFTVWLESYSSDRCYRNSRSVHSTEQFTALLCYQSVVNQCADGHGLKGGSMIPMLQGSRRMLPACFPRCSCAEPRGVHRAAYRRVDSAHLRASIERCRATHHH
jgi:hypothetical protein